MNSPFPVLLHTLWRSIGWFGFVLLLYLSLTPKPPEISLDHGDKLGHMLAYATLMFWWAQLLVAARWRLVLATMLTALGIALEYVQGWTGLRTFDYVDMVADTAGVVLGWIVALIVPNLLLMMGQLSYWKR